MGNTVFMKKESTPTDYRTFDFYVLLFFLLSVFGWLWETGLYLITSHKFANRGVNKGPYLPIYGVGGILLWFLLKSLHRRPAATFVLSAGLCSALEYATSAVLEWKWHIRWWDYSDRLLNLNGRICLLSAVAFGLGGTALNCRLIPQYMKLYHKVPKKWRIAVCVLFLLVFAADITYCSMHPNTGNGITE